MSLETPHVLIVDDDDRIRALLGRYLMKQGWRASGAPDAASARRLLGAMLFDLLIVDVMMPGEDGLSFTRWAQAQGGPPLILLTARGAPEDRIRGLEAGADDYLAKPFEPRELMLRAEAILRRAARRPESAPPPAPPSDLRFGDLRYETARGTLWRAEEAVHLTGAESALMAALARRPHEAVSRAELAAAMGEGLDDRAVDVQIARLRRKLDDDALAPRRLHTARGVGYRLTPD